MDTVRLYVESVFMQLVAKGTRDNHLSFVVLFSAFRVDPENDSYSFSSEFHILGEYHLAATTIEKEAVTFLIYTSIRPSRDFRQCSASLRGITQGIAICFTYYIFKHV